MEFQNFLSQLLIPLIDSKIVMVIVFAANDAHDKDAAAFLDAEHVAALLVEHGAQVPVEQQCDKEVFFIKGLALK